MSNSPNNLITASAVAEIFGCSVGTVHRMVADGRIVPVQKLSGNLGAYLFDADEIERIAAAAETVVRIPKAAS